MGPSTSSTSRVAARLSELGAETVVDECSRDLNLAHCDALPQDKLMAADGPLFEIAGTARPGERCVCTRCMPGDPEWLLESARTP